MNHSITEADIKEYKAYPLKWTGGKRKLLEHIVPYIIRANTELGCDVYVEPFFGGGSIGIWSLKHLKWNKAVLTDINHGLISFWNAMRFDGKRLSIRARKLANGYKYSDLDQKKQIFANLKNLYNAKKYEELDLAVVFYGLTQTVANGLWRENNSGQLNTPWGKYQTISYNPEIFAECASVLKQDNIYIASFPYEVIFEQLINLELTDINNKTQSDFALDNVFLYLDPPYYKEEPGKDVKYSRYGFLKEDQIKLANYYKLASNMGAKLLMSNSDTALIRDLYKDFNIRELTVYRSNAFKAESRKQVQELLISNFTIDN